MAIAAIPGVVGVDDKEIHFILKFSRKLHTNVQFLPKSSHI